MKFKKYFTPFICNKSLYYKGIIEGYASVFDKVDRQGDVIKRGAFQYSFRKNTLPLPMLWEHQENCVIGKWTEIYEDEKGLYIKGKINNIHSGLGKKIHNKLKKFTKNFKFNNKYNENNLEINGLSIGFLMVQHYYCSKENARIITQVNLKEVSLVAIPANQYALIKDYK